jgi:pimeloyl-ACP methyl ester carboxylesterase
MKLLLLILCLIILNQTGFGQKENFQCLCSKIGLDSKWADSNKVSCFLIPVDKDHEQPKEGKHILAVAITESENQSQSSPLLYLHGGPGIATLGNLRSYLRSSTWKLIRQNHDLIFFDYRGTGFSEPDLCNDLPDSLLTFAKLNSSAEAINEKEISLYKDCRESLLTKGINLKTFSSFQLAADAEAIRKVLKIDKWNIYGVSYGTTVALNIIRHFSSHVKSVILDSPFPPNAPWNDFVRPFDAAFKVLEKKIQKDPTTEVQFANLRDDFAFAVKRLNQKPVPIFYNDRKDSIKRYYTGDNFAWSIWTALLKPRAIPFVPLAIKQVASGNDSILTLWSTAFSSSDAYGKYSEMQSRAILCFEGKPRKPEDSEDSLLKKYPEFTSFNSGLNIPICKVWRPDDPDNKIFWPVVSDVPVLIFSGEYDPVCPPLFGELTAKSLPNSIFINVHAASHAAIHADDCLRNIANNFISDPLSKLSIQCVSDRSEIKFITSDLFSALEKIK